jgi:hypothetical protein
VHVTVADYPRPRYDRVRVFRVNGPAAHMVATLRGSTTTVGPTTAYVGRFTHGPAVLAVDLATGEVTRLTEAESPDMLALSPDAARLAFQDGNERIRVIDLATGRERSRPYRYASAIEWLGADRLLIRAFRKDGTYDAQLKPLRRYRYLRMLHQAHVGNRIFGTDGYYRLRSLNLDTGRRRGVARLTDRGVLDLVGVPGRPAIAPGTRRPASPARATSAATSSSEWCSPRERSAPARGRRQG